MVYTHPSKAQVTEILIRAIRTIETRYKGKVVFVRTDGERALGKEWTTYMAMKGITFLYLTHPCSLATVADELS